MLDRIIQQLVDGDPASYLKVLSSIDHRAFECLDIDRMHSKLGTFASTDHVRDFEIDGRGAMYLRSLRMAEFSRRQGALSILRLAIGECVNPIVCDLLAGDGFLQRVHQKYIGSPISFLNSDSSLLMCKTMLGHRIFSLWQCADDLLWLKANCANAVIFAYGTHHIDMPKRVSAFREAKRVLTEGGRIVIHDFDEGSNESGWFHDVVDEYSSTGHNCAHFSGSKLSEMLRRLGFQQVTKVTVPDCIEVAGDSEKDAVSNLVNCVQAMYDLSIGNDELLGKIEKYFPVSVTIADNHSWCAKLQRSAMVCHAINVSGSSRK